MSYVRGKPVRPLGAVRLQSSNEKLPKIAPSHGFDAGVFGSAMAMPPHERPEPVPRPIIARSPRNHSSSSSNKSDEVVPKKVIDNNNAKEKKELKESLDREKLLKLKQTDLEALIEELRAKIVAQNKTIEDQQECMNRQEARLTDELEAERRSHGITREDLQAARETLTEEFKRINQVTTECEGKIKTKTEKNEAEMASLRSDKDNEIRLLSEKVEKLKKQMADTFKGNSWERQQQLDELTKELQKIQEESDMLRTKLKQYKNKPSSGSCSNCSVLSSNLDKVTSTVQDKDKRIKDLDGLCAKFEKQLNQQDALLKQWQASKTK